MLYCAKFYGGGFGRVYEPKTPVIKLCTVQHYSIIKKSYLKTFSKDEIPLTLASPDLLGAFYDHVDDKMAQF